MTTKQVRFFLITLLLVYAASAEAQTLVAGKPQLIYSTTQDKTSALQVASIKNTGPRPVAIRTATITGIDASAFRLEKTPSLPVRVAPQDSVTFAIAFTPNGETGFLNATLVINEASPKKSTGVKLYGLSAEGLEGENEPPLHQVVLTLGYAVEVGSSSLKLGTDAEPTGEEITAPRFIKVSEGNVTMQPVARYSPREPVPFGYYTPAGDTLQRHPVGILSANDGQHQTLLPRLDSGRIQFDPGETPFGLFTKTKTHCTYTDDERNTGVKHAVRVYPLRDRRGQLISNSYLVCFEEAKNGDYQDFVFVVSNVVPSLIEE